MPVAKDSQGGGRAPGKSKGDNQVVRHNPAAGGSTGQAWQDATTPPPPSTTPPKTGTNLGTKDPYAAAVAKANAAAAKAAADAKAEARKQKILTRDRYIEDAERLGGQVRALRAALGPKGAFRDALETKLENNKEAMEQQLGALEKGFGERWGSLDADELNNEIAVADTSVQNEGNRVRERTMALGEAAAQGAGESDQLRTQLMSLRNWDANQNEANRAYHDGARSIQNSRIDLVGDTRTAMQNVWYEADADKQQLWNDFHAQQSESRTALGNALGQQAEYYGLAKAENVGGKVSVGGGRGGKGGKGGQANYDPGSNVGYSPGSHGVKTGGINGRPNVSNLAVPEDNREGQKRGKGKGTSKTGGHRDKRMNLGKAMDKAERQSDRNFMRATNQIGMAYDSNGMPANLETWGDDKVKPTEMLSNSLLQSARTTIAQQRPEGATLRTW
jgi:hypothetical protein